jgi:hypothetical protein
MFEVKFFFLTMYQIIYKKNVCHLLVLLRILTSVLEF